MRLSLKRPFSWPIAATGRKGPAAALTFGAATPGSSRHKSCQQCGDSWIAAWEFWEFEDHTTKETWQNPAFGGFLRKQEFFKHIFSDQILKPPCFHGDFGTFATGQWPAEEPAGRCPGACRLDGSGLVAGAGGCLLYRCGTKESKCQNERVRPRGGKKFTIVCYIRYNYVVFF